MNKQIIKQINSFLRAFSWINSKTNHGYTFDISEMPCFKMPEEAVNCYISSFLYGKETPKIHIKEYGSNWKSVLLKLLGKWLFEFQTDTFKDGRFLNDKFKEFSLSHESFRTDMMNELIRELEGFDMFIYCYEVELEFEKEFYECAYNDVLLLGRTSSLYIHLGVSD